MSLLVPIALLGLLTVPIILLLHLLRNRRKQMPISSLRLWRELDRRKHGALPRHIPLSLMLLLQLAAAVALTLALARPASSFLLNQPQQTIYILDTTTSMAAVDAPAATGQLQPRFDTARQIIARHIQTLDENDTVAVIDLNREPRLLFSGGVAQQEASMLALSNLLPGGSGAKLPEALSLANGLVDPEQANQIVVLTDGDYPVDPRSLPNVLAPITWQLIPDRDTPGNNQALLNVSSRRMPDGRHRLFVRVVNFSDAPVSRTLRLMVDGEIADEQPVQLEAQADASKVWSVSAHAKTAVLELVEADDLPPDNRAELPLLGAARHRVLLLSDLPDTLARAFQAQAGIDLTIRAAGFDRYDPADFDLIVFDTPPPEQTEWPGGNVLVVNPPLGYGLLPSANFARGIRPNPETVSELLAGVDLSGVFFNRAPDLTLPEWAQIDLESLADETGQTLPLIFHGNVGSSRVMVWGFDLNASNLPARLALPLLTANTISTLLTPAPLAAVSSGQPVLLAGNYSVELPDGRRLTPDTRPGSVGALFTRTRQPGLYKIFNNDNQEIAGFAVHAGAPDESNLTQQFQPESLATIDSAALAAPNPEIAFDEFWPLLTALVLVVVTFEGWLAWRK